VLDPVWYGGSAAARDAALERLPRVAVAPRHGRAPVEAVDVGAHPSVDLDVVVLDVHPDHHHVSSTGARAGREDWMLPEAAAVAGRHPAWRR
jgi:hypothetical protein